MSNEWYEVRLLIPSLDKLGTITEVLKGEAQVIEIVTPTQRTKPPIRERRERKHSVHGDDILLEIIKEHPGGISREELKNAFVAKGYAATSESSYLSRLCRNGKVTVRGDIVHLTSQSLRRFTAKEGQGS